VINELHAVYAKRNIEVPGMIWHRIRPVAWRAEELSGYGPRIVSENAELLKLINQQIQNLDKELAKGTGRSPSEEIDDDSWSRPGDSRGGKLLDRRHPKIS
jgi:hypothetical protein